MLEGVKRAPRNWNFDAGVCSGGLRVGFLAEDNSDSSIHKLALHQEYFLEHGLTDHCIGCHAILRGTFRQAHSAAHRERMPMGQRRIKTKVEKDNARLAAKMSHQISQLQSGGSSGSELTHRPRPDRDSESSEERVRLSAGGAPGSPPRHAEPTNRSGRVSGQTIALMMGGSDQRGSSGSVGVSDGQPIARRRRDPEECQREMWRGRGGYG